VGSREDAKKDKGAKSRSRENAKNFKNAQPIHAKREELQKRENRMHRWGNE
jgi:hypothetical protein